MSDVIEGVIHGRTIELTADPGLADGQRVEVRVRPVRTKEARIEAIRSTAGSLAHLPPEAWNELDRIIGERQGAGAHREVPE